jgi:acetyltransferase-like isoleucine patch superfamily enzyme
MGSSALYFLSESLPLGISFPRCLAPRLWRQDWEKSVLRQHRKYLLPGRLDIGDHSWIGDDVAILSLAQVTIDSNVCVARRSFLCTGSHDFRREDFPLKEAPIVIRQGSWIAIGSLILAGVTIGEGAVVSAGSVVRSDVPANCLVRGNPATVAYEIFRNPRSDRASVEAVRPRDKMLSLSSDAIVANADNINYPDSMRRTHAVETGELPNSQ